MPAVIRRMQIDGQPTLIVGGMTLLACDVLGLQWNGTAVEVFMRQHGSFIVDGVTHADLDAYIATAVDSPPAPGSILILPAQNKDTVAIPAGAPCMLHPSGTGVLLASATVPRGAVGLIQALTVPTFAGQVQLSGLLTLPDWTAITGQPMLAPLASYFLDVASGMLTLIPPTVSGQIVQSIGAAVAPNVFKIDVQTPFLL